MEEIAFVCFDPESAHAAAVKVYSHAKAEFENGTGSVRISCGPSVEPVSIRQRRFLHGVVLRQVSEQAKVDGVRFTVDIWKEYFRRKFVGDHGFRWESMRLPGQKHATPRRVRISTEELGPREYGKFIDQIVQDAALELGVEFVFTTEEQTLLPHKPKKGTPQ